MPNTDDTTEDGQQEHMPAVAVLAERLKRLRRRMQDQKRELRQALDEIHQMATHDSLTGLMNRRCLDDLLDKEIRRSAAVAPGSAWH